MGTLEQFLKISGNFWEKKGTASVKCEWQLVNGKHAWKK